MSDESMHISYIILSPYGTVPDPCAGPSVVCANGGTCSRTGLAETGCQCAGGYSGPRCDGELEQHVIQDTTTVQCTTFVQFPYLWAMYTSLYVDI